MSGDQERAARGGDPWSAFTLDPRDPAHGDLRASDADRDVVVGLLGEAYADGRLDRDELDERTAALQRTRTLGALPPLFSDLVAPTATRPPAPPGGLLDLATATPADLQVRAEAEWEARRRAALLSFLGPTLICWVIWLAIEVGQPGSFPATFPWPLIVTAATGFHAARTLTDRRGVVDGELRRLHRERAEALGGGTAPGHEGHPGHHGRDDGDDRR